MLQPSVPSRCNTVPVPPALPDAFNNRSGWPIIRTFVPATCRLAGTDAGAFDFATAIFTGAAFIAVGLAGGALTGSTFATGLIAGMAGFWAGMTSEETATGLAAGALKGSAFATGLIAGIAGLWAGVTSEATTSGFAAASFTDAAGTREASLIFF